MLHEDTHQRTRLYARWWFWVLVVIAALAALQLHWYLDWRSSDEHAQWTINNQLSHMYWQYLEGRSASLEEAYRNDTAGGETPEETLRLFVEALEDEDFERAASYFVPEEQQNARTMLMEGKNRNSSSQFSNIYRQGNIVPPDGVGVSGIYEVEIYENATDTAPFRVRFIQNEFTNVWKILEL